LSTTKVKVEALEKAYKGMTQEAIYIYVIISQLSLARKAQD
jgi:hypothetical protein